MSSLNYCLLMWMFRGKTANNEINKIHERGLRILFNDYDGSFQELLQRDNEQTPDNPYKKFYNLMAEAYKSLNCLNPIIMWDLFTRKDWTCLFNECTLCNEHPSSMIAS